MNIRNIETYHTLKEIIIKHAAFIINSEENKWSHVIL